jgi:hypothetical protein
MTLEQIRNKAAPSELIPEVSIRRSKLIRNQLAAHAAYVASRIPSGSINHFLLNYTKSQSMPRFADRVVGCDQRFCIGILIL